MIVSFRNKATEAIFDGRNTSSARRALPQELHARAAKKMEVLNASISRESVGKIPASHLEKLKGDRKGQYSVRINDQYRICFRWTNQGPADVEVVDYH